MLQSFARSAEDDDAGGVVGLDAAIEMVQRLADKAAVDHVLDREACTGLGASGGAWREWNIFMRHLLGRRAVTYMWRMNRRGKLCPALCQP